MRIVDIDNGSLQHQPYCNDRCNIIYVLNFSQRKKSVCRAIIFRKRFRVLMQLFVGTLYGQTSCNRGRLAPTAAVGAAGRSIRSAIACSLGAAARGFKANTSPPPAGCCQLRHFHALQRTTDNPSARPVPLALAASPADGACRPSELPTAVASLPPQMHPPVSVAQTSVAKTQNAAVRGGLVARTNRVLVPTQVSLPRHRLRYWCQYIFRTADTDSPHP